MATLVSKVDTFTDVKVYRRRMKLTYVPIRSEINSIKIGGVDYTTAVAIAKPYNYKRRQLNLMPTVSAPRLLKFPRRFHMFDGKDVEVTYKYNNKF